MDIVIKILIVVTSHGILGQTGKSTGYYLSEVAHPYKEFVSVGFTVDIASPKGGNAPMDERSRDLKDPVIAELMNDQTFVEKLENTKVLKEVDPIEYHAIVFAGGHGTMWDFPNHPDVNRISAEIYDADGVVAAICHGPAALLGIRLKDGSLLIKGKNVTGFSNAEEDAVELTQVMPFVLETEMRRLGALYSSKGLWQENVIIDDRLVTGQNPASATGVAKAVVKLLRK